MTGCRVAAVLAAIAAAAAPAGAPGAAAQSGEVGASVDGQRFAEGGSSSAGTDYRLWVRLPWSGTLLSPRLATFQFGLQPTLVWQTRTGEPDPARIKQLNFSAGANLFSASPVGLTLGATRTSSTSSGGLGAVRDLDMGFRSASLWVRFRPLPVHASHQRQSFDETWRNPGSAPLETRTRYAVTQIAAANSKVSLVATRSTFDDLLRDFDQATTAVNATHTLRWGRASRLESAWGTTDQEGNFAYRRREWSERLYLYHDPAVRTSHYLSRNVLDAGVPVTSTSLGSELTGYLGRTTSLGVRLGSQRVTRAALRDQTLSVIPVASVRVGQPRGVRLNVTGAVGIERRDVRGAFDGIPVVDEPYAVPASRLILLDRTGVDAASLVVRRADGSLTYGVGEDYLVRTTGREVSLEIPPSSRIAVGEQVLVSYRYAEAGGGRSSGFRGEGSATLSAGGVTVQYQRSFRQSGTGVVVPDGGVPLTAADDFDDERLQVILQGAHRLGRLDARAGVRSRDRGGAQATEYQADVSLTPKHVGPFEGALALLWTSSRTDAERQDGTTASAHVGWPLGSAVQLRVTGEAGRIEPSNGPVFDYQSLRFDVVWQLDRLEFGGQVDFYRQIAPLRRFASRTVARLIRRL
ncbi:MAG: hypothetical protein AB7L66_18630 [Gemmatimonadales bacterium]